MRESLAGQVYDVMRLAVGAPSGDLQLSVVSISVYDCPIRQSRQTAPLKC